MFLKRLESVGFKSFAERIQIEFVPGVTAVVGPNGSGKSNITDAIRWVLGEQSARSIRGTRMEDIIFQGSDTRNALNVAEVTLILNNESETLPIDYDEVSVTRRVYRSGASEFFINKQPCRLKDIIDLFLDSGLGREAFSIIGQGQVEEILSSKADERRVIFEEAAGVLKYKQRKQESEYKLAETDENLHRINDIIYEIEQQIEPLEKQAEIAERYLEKRAELKQHEVSLIITEIGELHEKWQTLLKSLEKYKGKELDIKTNLQKRDAKLSTEQHDLQQLDEAVETLQETLLNATKTLEQLEGQRQVHEERSKHFSENKATLEHQISSISEQLQNKKASHKNEEKLLSKIKNKRQSIRTEKHEIEQHIATYTNEIPNKIEQLKADYIDYLSEQAAKRNEHQSIQRQIDQSKVDHDQQTKKFTQLQQQSKINEEKMNTLKEQYDQAEKEISYLNKKIYEGNNTLKEYRNNFQSMQKKLNDGYQILAKEKSRRDMLQEMREDYQGYFYGVKSILKAAQTDQTLNIIGPVAELIDVPKEYVQAIETTLGSQSQHIVVNHEQDARQAIQWLRKNNRGRATFLPLNTINKRFVPDRLVQEISTHKGFVNIAANLVQVDDTLQQVVEHLMGHIIIVKDLKAANEIAKIVNFRFRIVTLEGDVVNPGGSMAGGSTKRQNQSLFTREQDLQKSIDRVKDFEQRIANFEKQLNKEQSSIDQLTLDIQATEKTLQTKQTKFKEVEQSYHDAKMTYNITKDHVNGQDADMHQFRQEQERLNSRSKDLTAELTQLEKQLNNLDQEIKQLTERQLTDQEKHEQYKSEVHKLTVQLAEQEERLKNQQEKCTSLLETIHNLTEEKQGLNNQLKELINDQLTAESEQKLLKKIKSKQEAIEIHKESIRKKRQERHERTQKMEDESRELKELRKQHDQLAKKIQAKEVKATRFDVALENKLSQLQTDYQMSYERAAKTYEKTTDLEQTKEIVQNLKQSIDSLGRVNLGAIDEFKRISERYTFLTEQKEDLVEAKQSLLNLIAEMDEEMKDRFSETFQQIKKEFTTVFKELFGGGRAELKLTDPKNMLDTGIDIIAQPPGKKLQHLGLLSGGERSLTAIALLFAILRVRPVPFCVLDEVEAALDEANVTRFAKYLNMHSEDTQFIVITHRKGTMEEADVLYGVTMQESGVSRLVSVRLEDTEELVQS